jgi:hypothetical protein
MASTKKHRDREQQLESVMAWVEERLGMGDVPRFSDVVEHAHRVFGYVHLSRAVIVKRLRLMPAYLMTSQQARQPKRSNKHRPILVNYLGALHCDIGFFSVTREYETPVTYRSGFLVAKDVLSRMVYVSILRGSRTAENMIWAFRDIIKQFELQNNGQHVVSISFDMERSVMGNKVQAFFKENNISFFAFSMTASKSKMAEGAIRLIRTSIARLRASGKEQRWWHLIHRAVDSLNGQAITIGSRRLEVAPRDVTPHNVDDLVEKLQKADPSYFFSQFDIAPTLVTFKFSVGDLVRPKLIITSSAVIGIKRSEITLEHQVYEIVKQLAYVTKAKTIGLAYRCRSLTDESIQVFDQQDVALSVAEEAAAGH